MPPLCNKSQYHYLLFPLPSQVPLSLLLENSSTLCPSLGQAPSSRLLQRPGSPGSNARNSVIILVPLPPPLAVLTPSGIGRVSPHLNIQ